MSWLQRATLTPTSVPMKDDWDVAILTAPWGRYCHTKAP